MVLRKDWNKNKLFASNHTKQKRQESDGKELQFYLLFRSKFDYTLPEGLWMVKFGFSNSDYCTGAPSVSLYICIEINVNNSLY